jgi:hypothetical protein
MGLDSVKREPASFSKHVVPVAAMVAAFALVMASLNGARTSAQPVTPLQPTTPMQMAPPAGPKPYKPGLVEFMLTIQSHHAKLWHAARARNWPLADYQLDELKEAFEDVQAHVPIYKDLPVGQMIASITAPAIAELAKAIEQKQSRNFAASYRKLTDACNDCHKAASRPYIVIQRPSRPAFDNQDFRPPRR